MRDICGDFETELAECIGEANHVPPLVHFPPKVAVSKLVNSLKGVSPRLLRKEFDDLCTAYWKGARLWSGSYFAGSVGGALLSGLQDYIEQQARPWARRVCRAHRLELGTAVRPTALKPLGIYDPGR